MTTVVKTRHIGMTTVRVVASYDLRADAEKCALTINCMPFTPYYAWIEDVVAPAPTQHPFIGA